MHQQQRTQIYLPTELRREVDKKRALSGESLSEYLRKALKERLEKEGKQALDLKKLAELLGSVSKEESGWKGIDVLKWQREIRKDRKIFK